MSDERLQIRLLEWIQSRYRENRRYRENHSMAKTIQDENGGGFETEFGAGYFGGKETLLFQMMYRFLTPEQMNELLKENDE